MLNSPPLEGCLRVLGWLFRGYHLFRKDALSPPFYPQWNAAFPLFSALGFWGDWGSFPGYNNGKGIWTFCPLPVHLAGLFYSLPISHSSATLWTLALLATCCPRKPLNSASPMSPSLWPFSLTCSNLLPITSSSFSLFLAKGSALSVFLLYFSDFPHDFQSPVAFCRKVLSSLCMSMCLFHESTFSLWGNRYRQVTDSGVDGWTWYHRESWDFFFSPFLLLFGFLLLPQTTRVQEYYTYHWWAPQRTSESNIGMVACLSYLPICMLAHLVLRELYW